MSKLSAVKLKIVTTLKTLAKSAEQLDPVFGRMDKILNDAIALGRGKALTVIPSNISVSATDNCNLKCIMCPGHSEMKGSKLSIEQAELLFESLDSNKSSFGFPKELDMTAGEPTLNRAIGPIYERFKTKFPNSKISMITNATIPIRGEIRQAFIYSDKIGISIDGANQETYERIRPGSVWKNVMRNVSDIVKLKQEHGGIDGLKIMFVAMDQNIHELPDMVKLTHSFGIKTFFVQVSEVRWDPIFNFNNQNVTLNLHDKNLPAIIEETKSIAASLGIQLILTAELGSIIQTSPSTNETENQEVEGAPSLDGTEETGIENKLQENLTDSHFKDKIRNCNVLWLHSPRVNLDDNGVYSSTVCCHMPKWRSYLAHFDVPLQETFRNKPISEMFNSDIYWQLREDLLNGKLAEACDGCQYYKATGWKASQLRRLEKVVKRAKQTA